MMKGGTIVDATIINAPGSTKNADKTRDPKMRQTKRLYTKGITAILNRNRFN